VLSALALAGLATSAAAQPPVHYQHKADMPPGAIGLRQLDRGGPLPGYFQPVEITAPAGALVSLVTEGTFDEPQGNKALAGMLIGQVYRLKVSNIKFREGEEVFPTIEVIDRLYPPPGQAARFPIPIELTDEELQMALDGRYVMRVIYVEPPRDALGVQDVRGKQRYFEVAPNQDPMLVADQLGRPVAILRMGSRVPAAQYVDGKFLYHSPAMIKFDPTVPPALPRDAGLEPPLNAPNVQGQPSRTFPRVRISGD
jgi:hypothetical protein